MQVLQIIDISKDIMYNIANGEKKLLALINATVSHEMRNPLNSIVSQNIKQIQINEKLIEFAE
jgi:signal transduction histidine kinase